MRRPGRLLWVSIATGLATGAVGAVLGVGGVGVARACSCVEFSADEALAAADVVFVGTVVAVDDPGMVASSLDPRRYTVEVAEVYKGEVPLRQDVVTAADSAACGIDLDERRWLIFGRAVTADDESADARPDAEVGDVRTSLCSGNRVLGTDAVPASFGAPRAPTPTPATVAPEPTPSDAIPTDATSTDATSSDATSTAGQLVLVGVVAIIVTGAILLTLRYRRR